MKNKKLLIVGASAASLAALGLGAFAFFYDEVETAVESKVGTVNVDVTGNITHTQIKREMIPVLMSPISNFAVWEEDENVGSDEAESTITKEQVLALFETAPNNVNPGDNEVPEDSVVPGTDHEIQLTVQNTGNKSVRTRILVEVSTEDNSLSNNDLRKIHLYFDPLNTVAGLSSVPQLAGDMLSERTRLQELGSKENSIVYCLDSDVVLGSYDLSTNPQIGAFVDTVSAYVESGLLLSGTGEEAEKELYESYVLNQETGGLEVIEKELPSSGSIKLDLGLDANAEDIFEGKKIVLKVTVQGMQLRNTSDYLWDDLFEQEFLI